LNNENWLHPGSGCGHRRRGGNPSSLLCVCRFGSCHSRPNLPAAPATGPLILVEGGKAGVFVLTVENISKPKNLIGIKNVSVVAVLTDGTDKSDIIVLPIPQPVSTCPKTITLAFGQKCTVIYTFTPVGIGPKENLDSGINSETTAGIFLSESRQPQFSCADAQGIFRAPSPPVPSF